MVKFKVKVAAIIIVLLTVITGTVLITNYVHAKSEPKVDTVVQVSSNPEEDVQVGKIALEKIHKQKEANLTSSKLSFAYPIGKGQLPKDAGFMKTLKHLISGRSISGTAYADGHIQINWFDIKNEDVNFDKKTHILHVVLPKPEVVVNLDKSKTDEDPFYGLVAQMFSLYYSPNELNRINQQFEDAGKMQFEKTDVLMEESKQDLKDNVTSILSIIDTVKEVDVTFKEK